MANREIKILDFISNLIIILLGPYNFEVRILSQRLDFPSGTMHHFLFDRAVLLISKPDP